MMFNQIIKGVLSGKIYERKVEGIPRWVRHNSYYDVVVFEWADARLQHDAFTDLGPYCTCPQPGDLTACDWEEKA